MRKLLLLLILAFPQVSTAQNLTETALFVRCYTQIVGERPALDHPLLVQVRNFQVGATTACSEVLDSAQLDNSGLISNTNDIQARKILRNFQRLHSSWLSEKDFSDLTNAEDLLGSRVRFDSTTPAHYFTRALFSQSIDYSSVVTGNQNLEARRSQQNPSAPIIELNRRQGGVLRTDRFDAVLSPFYAPRGDLLGIRSFGNRALVYRRNDNNPNQTYVHQHRGGGILGDPIFLTMNLGMSSNFRSNVAQMPRTWVRAYTNDLMCRDLPVIRQADAVPYVVSNSNLGFRRSASCVACHATMDQAIGVIRNIRHRAVQGRFVEDGIGFNGVISVATDEPASADRWPASVDNDYSNRPTDGQLLYRGFAGNLVDVRVSSLADLGNELSQQDEIYVCAAKRYYKYFLGIDANVDDIADPAFGDTLSESDQFHRDEVIRLGRALRAHQDSLQLVKDIMVLPQYRRSDFGVGE